MNPYALPTSSTVAGSSASRSTGFTSQMDGSCSFSSNEELDLIGFLMLTCSQLHGLPRIKTRWKPKSRSASHGARFWQNPRISGVSEDSWPFPGVFLAFVSHRKQRNSVLCFVWQK
jgi:hypothetical protein